MPFGVNFVLRLLYGSNYFPLGTHDFAKYQYEKVYSDSTPVASSSSTKLKKKI